MQSSEWKKQPLESLFESMKLSHAERPFIPEEAKGVTIQELINVDAKDLFSNLNTFQLSRHNRIKKYLEKLNFWEDGTVRKRFFDLGATHFMLLPNQEPPDNLLESIGDARAQTDDSDKFTSLFSDLADREICSDHPYQLPSLLLDHRTEVLSTLSRMINELDSGNRRGNGGSGRLLLGPKGTGKSTFLQSLAITAGLLCQHTIVIYIDYYRLINNESLPILPSEIIWYAIQIAQNTGIIPQEDSITGDLTRVRETLRSSKFKVLLIVDEFDKVYKCQNKRLGDQIIRQYQALGGAAEGLVFPIISGSSSALYDLAFAKLQVEHVQADYPSYTGASLNSGRYLVLRSSPLRGEESFTKLIHHIVHQASGDHPDLMFFTEEQVKKLRSIMEKNLVDEIEQLYSMSGGKFRYLQMALADMKNLVQESVRSFLENRTHKTLNRIFDKLSQNASNSAWQDEWLEIDNSYDPAEIYRLGDSGLLFVEVTKTGMKVTFETHFQKDLCKMFDH